MKRNGRTFIRFICAISIITCAVFALSYRNVMGAQTLVEKKTGVESNRIPGKPINSHPETRMERAIKLYNAGKLDAALKVFESVQRDDDRNLMAKRYIKNIIVEQRRLTERDEFLVQKDMILDVRRSWLPIGGPKAEPSGESAFGAQRVKSKQLIEMEKKSQQIIPEINFTDARLGDVVKYLSEVSGINIILDEDISSSVGSGKYEAPEEIGVGEEGRYEAVSGGGSGSDRVTIHLKNVPLIEALKYILSAKGLKYRLDEYAILISTPARLERVEMETRYYHLSSGSGVFTSAARKDITDEGDEAMLGRSIEAEASMTIKDVLEQSGVPFPPGSKIFLDQRTGTLIVRNTPANLAVVEKILGALDVPPFQVAIEAKFIEVAEGVVQELGIEAFLNNNFNLKYKYRGTGTGVQAPLSARNPSTGILSNTGANASNPNQEARFTDGLRFVNNMFVPGTTDPFGTGTFLRSTGGIFSIATLSQPQLQFILHALDQCDVANVLSAPKVTTVNNQQARIEVVTEVIYPSEFEITPPTTNNNGNVITPAVVIPSAFTTRDTGIILEVTPSVGADRKTINLTLIPEVSELTSWMDYGIPAGNNFNRVPVLQPFFTTRNVTTSVIINDGETVVLGGLIRDQTTR
ncbi:hypothetical protein ACFLQ8_02465, partial [Candidatus Auribacterota bacterium]